MWRSVRIREDRYDEVAALARDEGRSVASMVDRLLVRGVAVPGGRDPDSSLATGADAAVSAGLAVSSAPVASDGALAEPGQGADTGRRAEEAPHDGRAGARRADPRPGSASAPDPPWFAAQVFDETHSLPSLSGTDVAKRLAASVEGVSTAGDLAKKQVTPHLKSEQAGRKK